MRPHIADLRRELAEETCRDLRRVIAMRDCERSQKDWSDLLYRLDRWMRIAGKSKYADPKPIRSRTQEARAAL